MAASANRKAKIELTSSAAGMDAGLNDARRKMRAFQREQAKAAKEAERDEKRRQKQMAAAGRSSFGLAKSVALGAAAAAGFDVAGGLGGMVQDVFDTEKEMTRFQIDAQLSAQKVAQFRGELMKTSEATGVSRNALVHLSHDYQILTGDAEGAVTNAKLFADVMNATGASAGDIASTAAALHNMKLDPSQMREAFDILVYQGHKGAIEVRDLAGQMGSLQPMFEAFDGGASVKGIAELGAAMQVTRKGFGSPEEMATGLRAAMSQLMSPAVQKKLKGMGVNIIKTDPVTKKQTLRDFQEIIGEIHDRIGDDPLKLRAIFSNVRGFRAIDELVKKYDEMAQLSSDAANSNQVAKDAQTYMESSSGKLARAWEQIKNAVAGALTPERIDQFANAMLKAADYFGKIVTAADHLFMLFGGHSAKENSNTAEADSFLDPLFEGGLNDPAVNRRLTAKALKIASMTEEQAALTIDPETSHDYLRGAAPYGSWENMQAAARRFLTSQAGKGRGQALASDDLAQLRAQAEGTATAAIDAVMARRHSVEEQQRDLRVAKQIGVEIVAALGRAGFGVKVGSEPLVKAHANSMQHRLGKGPR